MLRIFDLSVSYGPVVAVRGISISVDAGESVAIIGSNGAGKTSLLSAVAGLLKPAGGRILLEGQDITTDDSEKRLAKGITLVPEGRQVFPYMTVEQNLLVGTYWRRHLISRLAAKSEVEEIYIYFPKLAQRQRQMAGTLSGGEQQMLVLGRALMSKPRLLLLDEPSLGLAPQIVEQVFEILDRLRIDRNLALCLVEQEAQKALSFCSRGYVIAEGRIALEGSAAELIDSELVRDIYLGEQAT